MKKANGTTVILCMVAVGLFSTTGLSATIEKLIDFEPSTYSTGTLSGQEYWSGGGSLHQVQNSNVLSGSQSVESSTDAIADRSLSQDNLSFQDGYIISYEVKMNNGGGKVRLDSSVTEYILVVNDARNYSSTQRIQVNGVWIGDPGYFKADEVYKVTLVLDFTNQQVDATVEEISGDNPGYTVSENDISFTHSATAEQAKNGLLRLRTFSDSSYGQGVQVIDDITFAVPEPATIGLLSIGTFGLIRRK